MLALLDSLRRSRVSRNPLRRLLFIGWLGLASLGLLEAGESFIPIEVLFQDYDRVAGAKISPSGRYLVGQRLKEVSGDRNWRVTFTWDFNESSVTVLSQGRKDIIRHFAFSSEDQLVYSYWVWFQTTPWQSASPTGGTSLSLIPPSGKVAGHPNKFLEGAYLVSPLPNDEDHALFATRLGFRSRSARWGEGDEKLPGLWKINTRTQDSELVVEAIHPTEHWWLDADGHPALAETLPDDVVDEKGEFDEDDRWEQTAERSLYLIKDNQFDRRLPINLGPLLSDEPIGFRDAVFSKDGQSLYYLSQRETDRLAIMKMDLETLESTVFREEPQDDIVRLFEDPYHGGLLGFRTEGGRGHDTYFDPSLAGLQTAMEDVFPDDRPRIADWNRARDRFLIEVHSARNPGRYYIFDRRKMSVEMAMDRFEDLNRYHLSQMEVIHYEARDGLKIEGYLTRPQALSPEGPFPLILYVHGGPWSRDKWGFDRTVQFLADRGYAVLQVNFRGSEGYGRKFLDAGNKEWGRAMQDDLTDAVEWAIAEGLTTRDRIGIMGESYGGYAAMAGLTFTPDLYQVGLAGMGLYDLTGRVDEFLHFWGDDAEYVPSIWRTRMGDEEKDADLLRAASPLFFLDRVNAPVFVFHGQKDRRVRTGNSFELVRQLRHLKKTVERSYLGGTGHSYGSEDTRIDLMHEIEDFLREYFPSDLLKD